MDVDIQHIGEGVNYVSGTYRNVQTPGYALTLNLFNVVDENPNFFSHVITDKTLTGYTAKISGIAESSNYHFSCDYDNSDNSGIVNIPDGTNEVIVNIPPPPEIIDETSYTVAVSLSNFDDPDPTCYHYTVTERTPTYFKVEFSDVMDSPNYYLEWILITHDKQDVSPLSLGITQVTIPLSPMEVSTNYGVMLELLNEVDSTAIIPHIVIEKRIDQFVVQFEKPIDTLNYSLMWSRPIASSILASEYNYYQTGNFINFDGVPSADIGEDVYVEGTQGRFDCHFGKDVVEIEIQDENCYLLQENSDYLLQEDGSRILLCVS